MKSPYAAILQIIIFATSWKMKKKCKRAVSVNHDIRRLQELLFATDVEGLTVEGVFARG